MQKATLNFQKQEKDKLLNREEVQEYLEECPDIKVVNGGFNNLEFTKAGTNKASGLKLLAEYLGMTMDEVMAVGDSENDIEMLRETGFCSGIENYSRHLAGLEPGQPPSTLIDLFGDDFLMIIDESHITVPQIGGMYAGDQSRKSTLVDFGFRLPSAKDNRPLEFGEFEQKIDQMLFVSATPGKYEEEHELLRAEQIIRPTGLLDPAIDVRPVEGQIDDLLGEIHKETKAIKYLSQH